MTQKHSHERASVQQTMEGLRGERTGKNIKKENTRKEEESKETGKQKKQKPSHERDRDCDRNKGKDKTSVIFRLGTCVWVL